MWFWEEICIRTVSYRLPYLAEEVRQARSIFHRMEYQVWEEWRRAWMRQAQPTSETSLWEAMLDVSGRQALSMPVIQEIVRYTEKRLWMTMENE